MREPNTRIIIEPRQKTTSTRSYDERFSTSATVLGFWIDYLEARRQASSPIETWTKPGISAAIARSRALDSKCRIFCIVRYISNSLSLRIFMKGLPPRELRGMCDECPRRAESYSQRKGPSNERITAVPLAVPLAYGAVCYIMARSEAGLGLELKAGCRR